ncbi:MAG: GNAT family N-acetyltransferase [Holophagales bacterium]|nr:GNAT family N-acetyltransferase [Holophagales bacterium]
MALMKQLTVRKVEDADARERALRVLEGVYHAEKGWVDGPDEVFPESDLDNPAISWFLAEREGAPVGVTRVLYEIPFDLYQQYQFQLVDPRIDVEAFVRENRIAEVGRFAVVPKYRKKILVAAILMRAAATETVERGFTHFITDVFDADPNSPYQFHRRILGFQTVATHETGEMRVRSKRITMLLDLREAYRRLKQGKNWIVRYITQGWNEQLLNELSA